MAMIARLMMLVVISALLLVSSCVKGHAIAEPKAKALQICSATGGLDVTRLVSSRTRNLFRAALEDVEMIREYVSEAAVGSNININDIRGGLADLNQTLDWEVRDKDPSATTVSAGLGYIDDRADRRVETYVSLANQPLVGDKETDLAFVSSLANLLPWVVDRKSAESHWTRTHQNGKSDTLEKKFDRLYVAAWIGTFGEAWMYYPPLNKLANATFGFGDILGASYSSHEEEFVKPNLPANNPNREARFTAPYPDTAVPGLSLITAQAPVYFTGEFGGFTYEDTYIASTGVDISVESMSSLLDELEGTVSSGSFAFLVTADGFDMVAVSQSTVEEVYPVRTGFEKSRVTYNVDGTIGNDRRNQTYLVSDTIFQSPMNLTNADWNDLAQQIASAQRGTRNSTYMNITLTTETEQTEFLVVYERWKDVADWALVVFAPRAEVEGAISVHPSEPLLQIALPAGKVIQQPVVLHNNGTMNVHVRIEKIPPWFTLVNSLPVDGELFIASGDSLTFNFNADSAGVPTRATGILAFTVIDDDYPDCFHEQVLTIPVNITITHEEQLNQLVGVRPYGFVLTAIVTITTIGCIVWTARNGEHRVVRASQPVFLYMMCSGILMMGLSIIPMSLDDSTLSEGACSRSCMAVPWLLTCGFSTTFAALFSKIWRINQIVGAKHGLRRVRVSVRQVMVPFVAMCSLNISLLCVWNIVDPVVWVRDFVGDSTFDSVGHCTLDGSSVGLVCFALLVLLNVVALLLALFQLYQARNVATEYSEGKYIAIAVGSMLQVLLTGLPTVLIISDNPQAKYFVMTTMVFVVTMSLLLLTFIPKFVRAEQEKSLSGYEENSGSMRPNKTSGPCTSPRTAAAGNSPNSAVRDTEQPLNDCENDLHPDENRTAFDAVHSLPFVSDISMSLPPISEYEPADSVYQSDKSHSESTDMNPKYPQRTVSIAEESTPFAKSDDSCSLENAKLPRRFVSEVEEGGCSHATDESCSLENARLPRRIASEVEMGDDSAGSEDFRQTMMVREPSKRTENHFSNAPLPRRAPSTVED